MATLRSLAPASLSSPRLDLILYDHSPAHNSCILQALNSPTAGKSFGEHGLQTADAFDAEICTRRLRGSQFSQGLADGDCINVLRLRPASWTSSAQEHSSSSQKLRQEEGSLIGFVSILQDPFSPPPSTSDSTPSAVSPSHLPPHIGWVIRESYMGQGYATEAANEVLQVAKTHLGLGENLLATFGLENPGSKRVAAKLGFEKKGRSWHARKQRWREVWTLGGRDVEGLGGTVATDAD